MQAAVHGLFPWQIPQDRSPVIAAVSWRAHAGSFLAGPAMDRRMRATSAVYHPAMAGLIDSSSSGVSRPLRGAYDRFDLIAASGSVWHQIPFQLF